MQVLDKKKWKKFNIVWIRRDLRFDDHRALAHAVDSDLPVLPLFIFDQDILESLDDAADTRVNFIHKQIERLNEELKSYESGIYTCYGKPEQVFEKLFKEYDVAAVFCAEDFEPYAVQRDEAVAELAKMHGVQFKTVLDHLIFHPNDVLKQDGSPYHVYTPYSRRWIEQITQDSLKESKVKLDEITWVNFHSEIISLEQMGFVQKPWSYAQMTVPSTIISNYGAMRDFPAQDATSRLGIHLRFGTISLRRLVNKARQFSDNTFLKQLIWREFFTQIMFHHPESMDMAFKPKYRNMPWKFNESHFDKWKNGQTGVPIVDAGMRELNETGWMHNRVRMIAASWLTKNLLMHWKLGERYFASKLLDFELASNVGSWQWVAGTGCDAAPYFRIFNPFTQQKKFDPEGLYVKKWVPEIDSLDYPAPMIDYKQSRKKCLDFFKEFAQ